MIPKPLSDIQESDILSLRDNQVPEGKAIEYKRDLPGTGNEDRKEFLKDVSSFANTSGGDLLYGVDAVEGVPQDFSGIGDVNEDDLRLRLESMCRDGLEPRLPKIDFRVIPVQRERVLLVRVPKSWTFPHRVKFSGHAHFYGRGSAGTFQMDVGELRTAFTSSEEVVERIRNFRMERITALHAHDTPVPILTGCKIALHIIPLSAFAGSDRIDISQHHLRLYDLLPFGSSEAQLRKINLDGVLNYTNPTNGRSRAYTQIFRSGIVEAVAVFAEGEGGVKRIHSRTTEAYLIQTLPQYLDSLRVLQISAPVFLFMSLIGTTGYMFIVPDGPGSYYGHETATTDRYAITLPEVVMTDYGIEVDKLLRPAFDMIWNAFGYAGSPNFNAAGNWVSR